MNLTTESRAPLMAFSMTSVVLGFLSTLVFFMPVLGVPIALCGVVCGVIGLGFALSSRAYSLRWALGGIAYSLLALAVNLAIFYAPEGYTLHVRQRVNWQAVPDRPNVAPPR
jgi:hypothetical protein